jgi:hypothetical protein
VRRKAVLSIFILFFIPTLTLAFQMHDGYGEYNHSSKSGSGKCKITDTCCYVCRVSQRRNEGLCEEVMEKTIVCVPVENEV